MSQQMGNLKPLLEQLDINPADVGPITQLNGGASSSCVYRLKLKNKQQGLVLKFTSKDSPPYVFDRAVREYQLYRCCKDWLPQLRPRLLAALHDGSGVALLLPEYVVPAREEWTQEWLHAVLEAVCEVHASYWSSADQLADYSWLRRPVTVIGQDDKTNALQLWQQLLQRLGCGSEEMLARLINEADCLLQIEPEFPQCLCHGDFHIGNILTNGNGKVIIADWQEVGIGYGPTDIGFFLQRAEHSGFSFERREVISSYTALLNKRISTPVSADQVERIITASDLMVMLLQWPFYLQQASADTVRGFIERIEQNARLLGLRK